MVTQIQKINLAKPQTLEVQTRRKLVKSLRTHVDMLRSDRKEAISILNSRSTMARARLAGYEGTGEELLHSTTAMEPEKAFHKALKYFEQTTAQMERALLLLEAIVANEFESDGSDEGTMNYCPFCDLITRQDSKGYCMDCGECTL